MSLFLHDLSAVEPQLHARKSVYAVVNASVIWHIAPGHTAVRGIDDGITAQRGDISLPDVNTALYGFESIDIHDLFLFRFLLKVRILYA